MFGEILLNKLKSNKIVIYGIGANGIYTYRYLKSYDIDPIGFSDKRAGEVNSFQGIDCREINYWDMDSCIIVTPYKENNTIISQLNKKGFKNYVSWFEMECLFKMKPLKELSPMYKMCKEALRNNKDLKNKYKNKRCFIAGTGPSVKEQDLSLLKNEYVFTVNTGFKLKQFEEMNSNFHVFVDSMYFSSSMDERSQELFADEIKSKLKAGTMCFFSYTKAKEFISKFNLETDMTIRYLEETAQEWWDITDIDFTGTTPLTGAVVLTASLLAIYMGFTEINLLGVDCTDILTSIGSKTKNADMITYAWDNDKNQQKRLEATLGNRPLESIYHIQYLKFKHFRFINDICMQQGISLYNCTKGGLLDCIERKDYESIIFNTEYEN